MEQRQKVRFEMSGTPRMGLEYMEVNQSQKEVTFNQALDQLDFFGGLTVESIRTSPATSPEDGAAYLIGSLATGSWLGKDDYIAHYVNGAWAYYPPFYGLSVYIKANNADWRYKNNGWAEISHEDGQSAYQIAISNGFEGTEAEWLLSLVGPPGASGAEWADAAFKETDADGNNIYTLTDAAGNTFDFMVPIGTMGESGTDGNDGTDGVGITKIEFKEQSATGNVYTVILSNDTTYDITTPKGTDGTDGVDGTTPVKGMDYYTEADITELNIPKWQVVTALPESPAADTFYFLRE